MKNNVLTDDMLEILTSPKSWEVISTLFPHESQPVNDSDHHHWMRYNSHSHLHKEILVIIGGSGSHGYCGDVYRYSPGTIFIFDSFEEHDYTCPKWTIGTYELWLGCIPNHSWYSISYMNEDKWSVVNQSVLSGINATYWGSDIDSLKDLPVPARKLRIYKLLTSLFSGIVESSFSAEEKNCLSFQGEIIAAIEEHIRHTSGKGLNLDILADMSGYSKFHFERVFKQYTGLSVHHYIEKCREEKVQTMLKEGCRKKEIAHTLGFSSLSTFSRWYKCRYG